MKRLRIHRKKMKNSFQEADQKVFRLIDLDLVIGTFNMIQGS